jgi:superfamily II DNA or RNA helicase
LERVNWELETKGKTETIISSHRVEELRAEMGRWLQRFRTNQDSFVAFWATPQLGTNQLLYDQEPPFELGESPYPWIEDTLVSMVEAVRLQFSPAGRLIEETALDMKADFERFGRRLLRKEQKQAQEEARRRETMARLAEERRRKEQQAQARRVAEARKQAAAQSQEATPRPAARPRTPLPPVPVRLHLPPLALQETAFVLTELGGYQLREQAALWWVSNQSDDLLCLPHCRIEQLDYQIRTALRVLGPLRGRALLSDEVGLGKTIEAGLVIKELLTRGMVQRFLVLTVPSLVDQWEEELNDKFGLAAATTNHAAARGSPDDFWRAHHGIVASMHTLKQPAHLERARQVTWDVLVVDEAHYLRNRESQIWQAVNALPRQFLLLLTATPVQNSLEELYNLVTLLQPGQLPSPKEFRARFTDPKRPRQPRQPEELRRLLAQVMIRNTRANAGVALPPRRAETVLFTPDDSERAFWDEWDREFRVCLSRLNPSQASLWGRLLLQAAGSSPAAWRDALDKFPDSAAARAWREKAPLEGSWRKKCGLIPPLTRMEGGLVIFTQFLETQAQLARFLAGAGIEVFVVNGATPAEQRQPITEQFHQRGGALLLTHSGTEGRNLQFCHRLVNFDLPWNPMEIEQRIGRLHRMGQQHPVRIYNFVQVGTLQEHLLHILQEKLNLFELVVGETGLVLGESFSSDEFAEEVLRRWRQSEGRVAEAFSGLGDELAVARDAYGEVKKLDATLFAKDYESL